MRGILDLLAREDINVLGFVNNDSAEFGTVRLIVTDTQRALQIFQEHDLLCRTSLVIGIELEDKPGALMNLLAIPERMNVNVKYMYLGYRRENGAPIIILSCEDADIVGARLANSGYTVY